MNLLITICGRGGSKGIPGKNTKLINNQPLIGFSINIAKQFAGKHGGDIALSTDSDEIKNVAARFGLSTEYTRPAQLATDTAGKIVTITDLMLFEEHTRNKKYDIILDLDISSPMRSLEDLEAGLHRIQNDPNALNLFSVSPSHRNPYFNMVERQPNGYFGLVKKGDFVTRQSAPEVFDLNASFYYYRRSFFGSPHNTTINDRSMIYSMPHLCFDLDTPLDFEFMEYLLANNKLDFSI